MSHNYVNSRHQVISKKFSQIINKARFLTKNYNTINTYKHICLILNGCKIIMHTFNTSLRNLCNKEFIPSLHAEKLSIFKFFNNKRNKKKNITYTLLSLRFNNTGNLMDSSPCYNCAQSIKKAGFNKILFFHNNEFISSTSSIIQNNYSTHGFRKFNKFKNLK